METKLDEFCNRLELLETKVHILKSASNPNNRNLLKTLCNVLSHLEGDFNSLVESLEQSKAVNAELQVLLDKVIARNTLLDELIENNPSQIELEHKQEPGCDLSSKSKQIESERKQQELKCELSPTTTQPTSRINLLRPKSLIFGVDYVTEAEFSSVPKYMLGRCQLEALNACVDSINNAMEQKFAVMGKKRSKLTSSEMKMYMDYTNEENEIPHLKGQKFVTERNVASVNGQRTLDKRSLNIMTILRHLKKIEEVRRGTAKYYLSV